MNNPYYICKFPFFTFLVREATNQYKGQHTGSNDWGRGCNLHTSNSDNVDILNVSNEPSVCRTM